MNETEGDRSATRDLDASANVRTLADELHDATTLHDMVFRVRALSHALQELAKMTTYEPPRDVCAWDSAMQSVADLGTMIYAEANGALEPSGELLLATRIRAEGARP